MDVPLYGFAGHYIQPNGGIKILVMAGSYPVQAIVLTKFLMVDIPNVYNAIIGRPTLNAFRVITFMYHLTQKFSTPAKVKVVLGNSVETHRCYALTLKGQLDVQQETNAIENTRQPFQPITVSLRSLLPSNSFQMSSTGLESSIPVGPSPALAETDPAGCHTQLDKASRGHQRAQIEL